MLSKQKAIVTAFLLILLGIGPVITYYEANKTGVEQGFVQGQQYQLQKDQPPKDTSAEELVSSQYPALEGTTILDHGSETNLRPVGPPTIQHNVSISFYAVDGTYKGHPITIIMSVERANYQGVQLPTSVQPITYVIEPKYDPNNPTNAIGSK